MGARGTVHARRRVHERCARHGKGGIEDGQGGVLKMPSVSNPRCRHMPSAACAAPHAAVTSSQTGLGCV